MTGPLRADPPAIAQVATRVRLTAGQLAIDTSALNDALGPDPGPAGWPATSALRAAVGATLAHLGRLDADLRGAAGGLTGSADAYRQSDGRVTGRFEALS